MRLMAWPEWLLSIKTNHIVMWLLFELSQQLVQHVLGFWFTWVKKTNLVLVPPWAEAAELMVGLLSTTGWKEWGFIQLCIQICTWGTLIKRSKYELTASQLPLFRSCGFCLLVFPPHASLKSVNTWKWGVKLPIQNSEARQSGVQYKHNYGLKEEEYGQLNSGFIEKIKDLSVFEQRKSDIL